MTRQTMKTPRRWRPPALLLRLFIFRGAGGRMPALASLGEWWSRRDVAQANRRLQAAAALWLVVTIPLEIILWPTNPDFPQFYLGGVIARHGEWASLYPIPWSDVHNPGLYSDLTPTAEALRQRYDVPN